MKCQWLVEKLLGQIDKRLRQAFAHQLICCLEGVHVFCLGILVNYHQWWIYPFIQHTSNLLLQDLGRTAYQMFNKAVHLEQIMRQQGDTVEQQRFRELLFRLRDAKATISDWEYLMSRTPIHCTISEFASAIHLYPNNWSCIRT